MLICPLCGEKLVQDGKSYICPNRHCFDMARQGYVNLLPVQNKHSLHPGEDFWKQENIFPFARR